MHAYSLSPVLPIARILFIIGCRSFLLFVRQSIIFQGVLGVIIIGSIWGKETYFGLALAWIPQKRHFFSVRLRRLTNSRSRLYIYIDQSYQSVAFILSFFFFSRRGG
jgi:hypothetical protein